MLKNLILGGLNLYQSYIRQLLPPSCRFQPSCSEYARLAIVKYGPLTGVWLAGKRLLHCHPFSAKGGWDPLR